MSISNLPPTVIIIGAFERDNLGDLLFPKIISRYLPNYQLILASITGNDLTSIGGDLVYSIDAVAKIATKLNIVAVIHCGGETLACTSDFALKMDTPRHLFANNNYLDFNNVRHFFSNITNPLAYVYDIFDLNINKGTKVGFISVGGTSLDSPTTPTSLRKVLGKKLKLASTIYTRDKKTQKNLSSLINIKSQLHPDIVSLLPLTHQEKIDKVKKTYSFRQLLPNRPYLVFQCNEETLADVGVNAFASQLSEVSRLFSLSIIVQPMGTSINHGSADQLNQLISLINNKYPNIDIRVNYRRNIWQQLAIITNSRLNIGTSLHFRIISDTYNIPCVSYSNPKVLAYIKTWNEHDLRYVTKLKQLTPIVRQILNNHQASKMTRSRSTISHKSILNFFASLNLQAKIASRNTPLVSPKINKCLLTTENQLLRDNIYNYLSNHPQYTQPTATILSSKFFKLWQLYIKLKKIIK